MAITDPDALRKSQAIRDAQSAASTAQSTADAAQAVANTAMSTADGKNTVSHIVDGDPRPTDNAVGDLLFEHDTDLNGPVTFMGRWDGSDWESIELNTEVIAALDAGKITTGTLNAGLVTIEAAIGGGSKVVIDNTGFKGYDASNNLKTSVGSDGKLTAEDATIIGTFRNAPVGQNRLEIRPFAPSGWGSRVAFVDNGDVVRSVLGLTNDASLAAIESCSLSAHEGMGALYWVSNPHDSRYEFFAGFPDQSAGLTGTREHGTGPTRPTTMGLQANEVFLGGDTVKLTGTVDFTDTATKQSARNSLGLGNTTGALPIANGGTGATTAQAARNSLELGNFSTWDTGWIALTLANGSGAAKYRRVGAEVKVQVNMTSNVNAGAQIQLLSGALPAALRPNEETALAARGSDNGGASASFNPSGNLWARNLDSSSRPLIVSGGWFI